MRVLLAILVGVTQVAGPWPCCCAPARLFAAACPDDRDGCAGRTHGNLSARRAD